MNYVQGFGNLVWILGVFGISGGILYGIQFVDKDWRLCDREWLWTLWMADCIIMVIGLYGPTEQAEPLAKVCLMILAIYLVICTVMDSILCHVNDVIQYPGVIGGGLLALCTDIKPMVGVSLILFAWMQYAFFLKYYGAADGMTFLICALYLAGMGKEIDTYLIHMILCYVGLAMVQGLQGNINKRGKLIEPVPMLPYISFSFLLMFQPYAEMFNL